MLMSLFVSVLTGVSAFATDAGVGGADSAVMASKREAFCNITEYLGSSYDPKSKKGDSSGYGKDKTRVVWLDGSIQEFNLRPELIKGVAIRISAGPSSFGGPDQWFKSLSVDAQVRDLRTRARALGEGVFRLDTNAVGVPPMGLDLIYDRANHDRVRITCVDTVNRR